MADSCSQRRKSVIADVETIKQVCSKDSQCPFCNLEYSDHVFRFEYHKSNVKRFFWVNVTEDDYPYNSILTSSVNGDREQEVKRFDLRLPFIFNAVSREFYKELSFPVFSATGEDVVVTPRSKKARLSEESDDDDDDFCDADDYDDDYYGDENDADVVVKFGDVTFDGVPGARAPKHALLERDLHLLESIFPDARVVEIPALDDCEITVPISIDFLQHDLAQAWKLKPKFPVLLKLHVYLSTYLTDQSTVDVCQETEVERFTTGGLLQLKTILNNFLIYNLREDPSKHFYNNDRVESSNCFFAPEAPRIPARAIRSTAKSKLKLPAPAPARAPPPPVPARASPASTRVVFPDAANVPCIADGFLVQLVRYAKQRLTTLNEYCVVCDVKHPCTSSIMLKPVVCDKPLCIFAYQTLGVMSTVADDVVVQSEVVDLLIAMVKAAVASQRKDVIFLPYPTVIDPRKSDELAFSPNDKDYKKLQAVLDKLPPMEELCKWNSVELKKNLDVIDPVIHPLLLWTISSNRCHIVKLKPAKQLDFMDTPHQYLLRSSPPAKEAAFMEAKKKYGSIFAFHGSSIENWHSILRRGLMNASGTTMMVNGAAYGNGIYLSPHASMSFGYTRGYWGTSGVRKVATPGTSSRFLLNPNSIRCLALCEVIASPELKKNENIWVMPVEEYVVTRFFFVYDSRTLKDPNINSTNKPHVERFQQAIGQF